MVRSESYPTRSQEAYADHQPDIRPEAVRAASKWFNTYQPELFAEMTALTKGETDGRQASWMTTDPHTVVYDENDNPKYHPDTPAGTIYDEFQQLRSTLDGEELATQAARAIAYTLNRPAANALEKHLGLNPRLDQPVTPEVSPKPHDPITAWRDNSETAALALCHNDPEDFADAVAAMQQMMAEITPAPSVT